jgi:hypothetical protein
MAAFRISAQGDGSSIESLDLMLSGSLPPSVVGKVSIFTDLDGDLSPDDPEGPIYMAEGPDLGAPPLDSGSALPDGISRYRITARLSSPIPLGTGEVVSLIATLTPAAAAARSSFGLRLDPSTTFAGGAVTVRSTLLPGITGPTSYIGSAPEKITVDGALADWGPDVVIGDVDGSPIDDRSLDIDRFALSGTGDGLGFMVSVKGDMMGGVAIPRRSGLFVERHWLDSDGDGVWDVEDPSPDDDADSDGDGWADDFETVLSKTDPGDDDTDGDGIPDPVDLAPLEPGAGGAVPVRSLPSMGLDTIELLIDTDSDRATGYLLPEMAMGADMRLELRGREGELIESTLESFSGSDQERWSWSGGRSVTVGAGAHGLEGLLQASWLGLEPDELEGSGEGGGTGLKVLFRSRNWNNVSYDTSIAPATPGGMAYSHDRHIRPLNPDDVLDPLGGP